MLLLIITLIIIILLFLGIVAKSFSRLMRREAEQRRAGISAPKQALTGFKVCRLSKEHRPSRRGLVRKNAVLCRTSIGLRRCIPTEETPCGEKGLLLSLLLVWLLV